MTSFDSDFAVLRVSLSTSLLFLILPSADLLNWDSCLLRNFMCILPLLEADLSRVSNTRVSLGMWVSPGLFLSGEQLDKQFVGIREGPTDFNFATTCSDILSCFFSILSKLSDLKTRSWDGGQTAQPFLLGDPFSSLSETADKFKSFGEFIALSCCIWMSEELSFTLEDEFFEDVACSWSRTDFSPWTGCAVLRSRLSNLRNGSFVSREEYSTNDFLFLTSFLVLISFGSSWLLSYWVSCSLLISSGSFPISFSSCISLFSISSKALL